MHVGHEYQHCGAWTYMAALDVHQARVFGRCEKQNGIAPFGRLVEQVMTRPPYNQARRVFWIVDNCSAHRGVKAAERLRTLYPRLVLVHALSHASWLNQVGNLLLDRPAPRSLRPTISPTSMPSPSACWIFNTTGRTAPNRFNGNSRVRISISFSPSSKRLNPRPKIR
jgi:hypothetical protein